MQAVSSLNNMKTKICTKVKDVKDDITALDAILLECFKRNLFGKYRAVDDTVDDKVELLCKIFGVPNYELSPETWLEYLSDFKNTTIETKFMKLAFLDEIRNILTDKRPHIALSTFQKFMYGLDIEALKETENLKIPNEPYSSGLNDHIFCENIDKCKDSNDDVEMDINIHIANNHISVTPTMPEICTLEEKAEENKEEVLITDSTNGIDNEMLRRILLVDMENDLQVSYVYLSDHSDSEIKQESTISDTEDIPVVIECSENRFSCQQVSAQIKQVSTKDIDQENPSGRNGNSTSCSNNNDNIVNNNKNNNGTNKSNNKKNQKNENLLEDHKLEGAVEASEIFDLLKSLETNDEEIEKIKMSKKRKQANESRLNHLTTKAYLNSKRKKLVCVNKSYDNLTKFQQESHRSDLTDELLTFNKEDQSLKDKNINLIDLNEECENYFITTQTYNKNLNACNNITYMKANENVRGPVENFNLDNKTFPEDNYRDRAEFCEDFDFLRIMQEVEEADKALHNEKDVKNLQKQQKDDDNYDDDDVDGDSDCDSDDNDKIILIEDSDSENERTSSVNNSYNSNIECTKATTATPPITILDENEDFSMRITNNYDAVIHLYKIKRFLLKKGNLKGFKLAQQLQEVFLRNGF